MIALSFNRPAAKIFFVVPGRGAFAHTSGGPARHHGARPLHGRPLHLFFELDLRDMALGLTLPGLSRLPLYYAIRNANGRLLYKVVSDDQIEVIGEPYPLNYVQDAKSWFNEPDFPTVEAQRAIALAEELPRELHDAQKHSNLFDERSAPSFGNRFISTGNGSAWVRGLPFGIDEEIETWNRRTFEDGNTASTEFDEFLANSNIFIQVAPSPDDLCQNPECGNAKGSGLRCLLLIQPEHSDGSYNDLGGRDFGQLCFFICQSCRTVHAFNECT